MEADLAAAEKSGQIAQRAGDYQRALTIWQSALIEARHRDNKPYVAKLTYDLGVAQGHLGRLAAAVQSFRKALVEYRDLKNPLGAANALVDIGQIDGQLNHYDAALRSLDSALPVFRKFRDRAGEARALVSIGSINERVGNYDRALRSYIDALATSRQVNDQVGQATALRGIGDVDSVFGRYEKALRVYGEALTKFRHIKDLTGEARALNSAGLANASLGHYEEALRSYANAQIIFRRIKDPAGTAGVLTNIGIVDEELGRYDEALRLQDDALTVFRRINDLVGSAGVLTTIGVVDEELGRYADALRAYSDALATSRQIKYRIGEITALTGVGTVDDDLGLYAKALRSYSDALAISRKVKYHAGEAAALADMGTLYLNLGRSTSDLRSVYPYQQKALDSLNAALAIFRLLGDRRDEAATLLDLGLVDAALARNEEARSARSQAAAIARELEAPEILWRALAAAAHAEYFVNESFRDYSAAIDQIEQLRSGLASASARSSFLQGKLDVYDEYISEQGGMDRQDPGHGYDRAALQVFERKSARTIVEQIGQSAAHRFHGVDPKIVADEDAAENAVDAARNVVSNVRSSARIDAAAIQEAETRLTNAITQRSDLLAQIDSKNPAYYELRHPQTIDAATIQRLLNPGEVLLVYFVPEHPSIIWPNSLLWVVGHDPKQFKLVSIPGKDELQRDVEALHKHLTLVPDHLDARELPTAIDSAASEDLKTFSADSYSLYQELLPAVVRDSTLFKQAKSLIIVPSGPLYDLPWEALVTEPPTPGTAPHYLLQDHPVSYIPSASLLSVVRRGQVAHQTAPNPLLAFARPTMPNYALRLSTTQSAGLCSAVSAVRPISGKALPFYDLRWTGEEAEGARKALGGSAAGFYSEDQASCERVLALNQSGELKTYQYVLFATHGVMPIKNSGLTQPAIVLAHPERGNAFLTMADVLTLSLNADFVALSACNTGAGPHPSGEGVSGLTRAFLFAGTPAISVTLWKVADEAGPQLTPAFFAAMKEGKTPAVALQRAKIAMLKSSATRLRHPSAWAPTVIFGDGDTGTPR